MTNITNKECSYELILCDFTADDQMSAIKLANKLCFWLDNNFDKTKIHAAAQLIELKNESWLEEDESPITESNFIERIELKEILAFSNDSFQLFFDDGDIFWGHIIVVDIDGNFNFNRVTIAG